MPSKTFSTKFIEILREKIKTAHLDKYSTPPRTCLEFTLRKKDLKELEENDLKFLSRYVTVYKRGVYTLRPKGLEHFIRNKKYIEDDYAGFVINIESLVKEGLLKKNVVNGYVYWSLGDKILDPKEYVVLYKVDDETYETLFKELGYTGFYERFKDSLVSRLPGIVNNKEIVGEFRYKGIVFTLYVDKLLAESSVAEKLKTITEAHGLMFKIYTDPEEATYSDTSLYFDISKRLPEDDVLVDIVSINADIEDGKIEKIEVVYPDINEEEVGFSRERLFKYFPGIRRSNDIAETFKKVVLGEKPFTEFFKQLLGEENLLKRTMEDKRRNYNSNLKFLI